MVGREVERLTKVVDIEMEVSLTGGFRTPSARLIHAEGVQTGAGQ